MSSFDGAAAPQITQNLGAHHEDRSAYLANNICRICIALSELVVLPIFVEMDFILKIWLKNPPAGSTIFCQIMMFIIWFASTSGGICQVISGSGKIKWFKIVKSFFFLICLPLGYICFKLGAPAYTILILFALTDVMHRIIQLYLLKVIIHYDVISFMKEAYVRTGIVFVIMVLYAIIYSNLHINHALGHLLGILITAVFSLLLIYNLILRRNERTLLLRFVRNRIHL